MPGRRPKPTAMKELAGNPGHRPLNNSEPKPMMVAPEMPKDMEPAARREWKRIVPVLLRLGVLSEIDGKALAGYCDAYAHWEQARKEMRRYGLVVKMPKCDKMGNVIVLQGAGAEGAEVTISNADGETMTGCVLYELKANPAVSIYNTMGKLMKSFLIEFGLTPASRSKLKIEKPADGDPMADFLKRNEADAQAVQNRVDATKKAAPLMFDTGTKKTGVPDLPASAYDFEA